jgi:ABC-2 type transport system ATP-binding protein
MVSPGTGAKRAQHVIKVSGVTRRYGAFTAVDDVSFSIGHGEIVGLLGHNGAGKTTTMKMMTGYLEPSAGTIEIDGMDVVAEPKRVQQNLGYLPENLPLYPELSIVDYLDFAAHLRGVRDRSAAVRAVIEACELGAKAFDPIATLSRGYRQRVGVAQAILHKPRFLILDEPTSGLDPSQTQHMRDLIRQLAQHATVILSTHIMQEVDAVCDRVMILRGGQLVLDQSLEALQRSQRLRLVTDASVEEVRQITDRIDGVDAPNLQVAHGNRRRMVLGLSAADTDRAVAAVAAAIVQAGRSVYTIAPETRDLETVFREISDQSASAVAAA